jgi:hypothetical protein
MKLNFARIEALASLPGVQRTAVENFLMTLEDLTQEEALANLELDVILYRWNTETGRAIQQGIMASRLGAL